MQQRRGIGIGVLAATLAVAGARTASGQEAGTSTASRGNAATSKPGAELPMPKAVPPSPDSAPARPKAFREDEGLEVITVTAQKQAQNLQEVPISVATLNSEKVGILRGGGADLRFLSARVPSLTIESSFGRTFPRFYIRGIGNTDFDLNASQPVSLVLDEVVLENPVVKAYPLFDIDRVEVLRGPQGTLFGRNTPAGIVKFDTKKPTQENEAFARFTYGSFDFMGMEGAVSGPVIFENLSARLSLMYEQRSDWVDNLQTSKKKDLEGFREVSGRFQLLYSPNDRFSALLNAHAHTLDGTARVFRANIIKPGTDQLVDDFDRSVVEHDGQNFQDLSQMGFNGRITYDLGRVTLTSITAFERAEFLTRGDIDGGYGAVFAPPSGPGVIPFPSETADGIPQVYQWTQEVRVATNQWDRVNFQVGVFYFFEHLEIDSFSYATFNNGIQDGYASQLQETSAFAAFGSATFDVSDKFRLQGGLRYSDDQKDFEAERRDGDSPFGAPGTGLLTADPSATFLSWDLSAQYRMSADFNAYVKAARGFRAPSIQGRVLFGDALSVADSEKILSFEAGAKSQFLDNRARVNATGFYYTLEDQQLTAVGGEANFNTLLNADKSVGYGLELDAEFAPTGNLLISLGGSYNHTEIQDEGLAIAACGSGCTVIDTPRDPSDPTSPVVIDGNSLPHAPELIANATLRWGVPFEDDGEVFFYTDWAYRSRVHFFLYESEEYTDDYLLEGGVRVGYARYDGGMELAVFVRNVLDDTSRTGGIDFNNLTGFVNEPRTWGVEGIFRY